MHAQTRLVISMHLSAPCRGSLFTAPQYYSQLFVLVHGRCTNDPFGWQVRGRQLNSPHHSFSQQSGSMVGHWWANGIHPASLGHWHTESVIGQFLHLPRPHELPHWNEESVHIYDKLYTNTAVVHFAKCPVQYCWIGVQ